MLGIDLGRSRTGLALSDPLGVICRPLDTLREKDEQRLVEMISKVVREYDVTLVVLGLPRPLSGGSNAQLESVIAFGARLERELTVPVATWDERFTSKLAERGAGRGSARDAIAASYMLQNYLDSRTESMGDDRIHEPQAV